MNRFTFKGYLKMSTDSLSRYKRVTREEENLDYPFFTRIIIKYFISF